MRFHVVWKNDQYEKNANDTGLMQTYAKRAMHGLYHANSIDYNWLGSMFSVRTANQNK